MAAQQQLRRILRPRVLVYSSVLLLIAGAVATSIAMRMPFKVDVVRDRSSLARIVDDGYVENVYRLQIMNATESTQRYRVEASGLPGLALQAPVDVALSPAEARWVTVALRLPPEAAAQAGSGAHTVHFDIERVADAGSAARLLEEKSTFVVPR